MSKYNNIFDAARSGTVDDLRYFLKEKRADVNAKLDDGTTPLHLAASSEHVEVVKILISKGANVNEKNDIGATPLHSAAFKGNIEIVKILASAGADVSAKDNDGVTPIGYTGMLELLLPYVSPEERERYEAQAKKKEEEHEGRKSRYRIGVILHLCLSAAYLFILWGTDIIRTLWIAGQFIRVLPLTVFSLAVGIVSATFLKKSDYISGFCILIGMIVVQSITASVWLGNVGFLFFFLIGRILLNTLSVVPGGLLDLFSALKDKKNGVQKSKKQQKAIEELKNGAGYQVAVEILDELAKKGYEVNYEMSTYSMTRGHVGNFDIGRGTTPDMGGWGAGSIAIATYPSDLDSAVHSLSINNIEARKGYYFAIQNDIIGLLIRTNFESQEIPPLIKIAAQVIANSGYEFKHPEWMYEDPKTREYLNVMFQ